MSNRKKVYLLVAIIVLILLLIILLTILYKKNIDPNRDYDYIDNNDNSNSVDDGTILPKGEFNGEIIKLQNPGLAFEAYWAIQRLNVSSYSEEAMLEILDDEYLNYYNLNQSNIGEKIRPYKDKLYNIVNMEYAYYGPNYLCIITCDDGKKFLFRYSFNESAYSIFLDDYIEDVGYDEFVSSKLELILKEEFKANDYTIGEGIVYTDDKILENYKFLMEDFENVYNNILDEETKSKYSYDELKAIFDDEYSLFGDKFSKIELTKTVNENQLFTYSFRDVNGRNYTLTEINYFNFKVTIK